MVTAALLKGLILGAGMIIPIGAQNSFILNQGIKRNHHILAATICIICDVLLISIGILGGGKLISSNELLMLFITIGGILFLLIYGGMSLRSAFRNQYHSVKASDKRPNRKMIIATTFAVTLLNPHVYLDTIIILGSVGGTFEGDDRVAFALGTILASVLWFYALAIAAAKLAPWLSRSKVQQVIDIVVGMIMFVVAYSLLDSLLTTLSQS
ncbi:amino acid transporter [Psychrosphaera saromensis]|uniref:Amino acid transporter n=1 Tax=Psychrosphaera saromensis TaxID=716813 RepID=A0A2S7UQV9_9GAMM|nr:LysE/ArgO family amino acid transporter [Psychrosphaera saromensis]PQJ52317.1 amino acid transporter [Psychrosphaera saromensis]GHB72749.1 amino acid transporter [Psychrosphaera saromensis]GLQ13525.1 amino acid transporter [Psychrosphaera saromensis]